MINTKLLSLVLEVNGEINDKLTYIDDNVLYYHTYANIVIGTRDYEINLDTLGRLCKEWCFFQGYYLISGYDFENEIMTCFVNVKDELTTEEFEDKTELEAIIKATEWVAKEKGLLWTTIN